MRCFELALTVLVAVPVWCAAGSDGMVPFDPIRLDAGLAQDGPPAPWQGITKKIPLVTHYFLPTGFTFPVRLSNAIYSYNVESPAIAVVERNVEYLKKVVIPAGTQVIGTVAIQQDHDRILISFHTLVFPDTGDEVKFTGMALSLDGSAGLKGRVEQHKDSAVANTILRSLLTGTQSALSMAPGISPIAAGATSGLSSEATRELDSARQQQVATSISVDAETGLRVYIPQRLEY